MSTTDPTAIHSATPHRLLAVNAADDLRSVIAMGVADAIRYTTLDPPELDALADHPFDVAVLDIAQPGPEDFQAVEQLRQRWPRLKVIVVSEGRETNTFCRLLRQKVFAMLARPVAKTRLNDVLELAYHANPGWEDDVELLSGSTRWIQIRVACRLPAAERAAVIFRELSAEVDQTEVEEFSTACREMLMNAIEHGGHCDPAQSVFVNYVISDLALVFYLRDPGPGFSFRNLAHAAISNREGSLEHADVREQLGIRPGGFGILLAKNLVDELIYSERGNEVILLKHRRRRPGA